MCCDAAWNGTEYDVDNIDIDAVATP